MARALKDPRSSDLPGDPLGRFWSTPEKLGPLGWDILGQTIVMGDCHTRAPTFVHQTDD